MMFWFVLSLKSLIAASVRAPPGFSYPQQRLRNSTPDAQGIALYVWEGFCSFWQSKLECSCHEPCVLRICIIIYNFNVSAFCHNPRHDG